MTGDTPLLSVEDLHVSLALPDGSAGTVVDGASFSLKAGEILGMVGESGSGKSLTALAITSMLPGAARVSAGRIVFDGIDLTRVGERQMRELRGRRIGTVFQDPLAALNPLMPVGAQIAEALRLHGTSKAAARARAVELLGLVGIRDPGHAVDQFPHEFSGGMRQRVMIAIAVANRPDLLIADEPTTALDVTIQAEIIRLLARLRTELGTAIILITHDIGIVEEACDNVVVLYAGRVAETGPVKDVLTASRHPYTRQLIRCVPRLTRPLTERLPAIPGQPPDPATLLPGCRFTPRCELAEETCSKEQPPLEPAAGKPGHLAACWVTGAHGQALEPLMATVGRREAPPSRASGDKPVVALRDVVVDYRSRAQRRRGVGSPAVNGVTLRAFAGQTLGLVGESGSGKTTISRAIVGLAEISAGELTIDGHSWPAASATERAHMRRTVQLVFQDPYASLNPRWRVRDIVTEPLRNQHGGAARSAGALLERVGLSGSFLDRYPHELSGGQRQRVGIARALAIDPALIVADEPVSALDVSIQAQVINLLSDVREQLGIGLIFVAHDLAVVRHVSDEIAVIYGGSIVEYGPAAAVFSQPQHPYTATLMSSVPGIGISGTPAPRPASSQPTRTSHGGCPFRDRCPVGPLGDPGRAICIEQRPSLRTTAPAHQVACHFPGELGGVAPR